MAKFNRDDHDTENKHGRHDKVHKPVRGKDNRNLNPTMEEVSSKPPVAQVKTNPEEDVRRSLENLFDEVLGRRYHFYGIEGVLKLYRPKDVRKEPYLMFYVQYVSEYHEIASILKSAMQDGEFGIALSDLRYHPDDIEWWAPTEALVRAKRALAYYLHSRQVVMDVARNWWNKKREDEARERSEEAEKQIKFLRIAAIRRQLRTDFEKLTEQNAPEFVRYAPNKLFYLLDESGEALYFSADGPKIYVEEVDPGHPLEDIKPKGLFINRAALRNPEDGTLFIGAGGAGLAERARKLRCYIRNHPLIAKALEPRKPVVVDGVESMKGVDDEHAQVLDETPENAQPVTQEGGQPQCFQDFAKTTANEETRVVH